MPDLSEVMDTLVSIAAGACYPNGPGQPSVTGRLISIGPGWPKPTDLDKAFAALPPKSWVTVFPVPGSSGNVPQVLNKSFVLVPAAHGLTVLVSNTTVAVSGAPSAGEYLTILANGKSYSEVSVAGDTAASLTAKVSALVAVDLPGTNATGNQVSVVGAYKLDARSGAPVTLGRTLHTQRQQFMISIWAPSPDDRKAIAAPIDVALKSQNLHIVFADTTYGVLTCLGPRDDDNSENRGAYIRHLVYNVQYDTIEQYQGYEVTSAEPTFNILPLP